jgi:hypothetical protein
MELERPACHQLHGGACGMEQGGKIGSGRTAAHDDDSPVAKTG